MFREDLQMCEEPLVRKKDTHLFEGGASRLVSRAISIALAVTHTDDHW